MRDTKSQKFCGYLTYQLFVSEAFRALRPGTRDILILIYFEVNMASKTNKGKYQPVILNRNEIKMPYADIQERLKYTKKTVWIAFKEILAHGFLEMVKHGGGCKGDCKIYKISEKWRTWLPGKIISEIGKNGKIGWQKEKNKQYCRKPGSLYCSKPIQPQKLQ